jgi:hypothetical protein
MFQLCLKCKNAADGLIDLRGKVPYEENFFNELNHSTRLQTRPNKVSQKKLKKTRK